MLSLKVRVVLNRHSGRFLTLAVIDTNNLKTKPSNDQAQIKLNKEIIILEGGKSGDSFIFRSSITLSYIQFFLKNSIMQGIK